MYVWTAAHVDKSMSYAVGLCIALIVGKGQVILSTPSPYKTHVRFFHLYCTAFVMYADHHIYHSELSNLMKLLQRASFFQDVVHIYEPSSEQSIFVAVPLLLARYPRAFGAVETLVHLARDEISPPGLPLSGDLHETTFVGALQSDASEIVSPVANYTLIALI